jgi:CheY-like chemotaxis protein
LMDLQLPDSTGQEATRIILNEMGYDIPVIAISTDRPSEMDSKESLFSDFISKPFEPGEILRKISNYTRKKVLNLSYLQSFSEGNEVFEREILESALEIIPQEIVNLKLAFKKEDFSAIKNISHKLRSTYSILGINAGFILHKLEKVDKQIDRNTENLLTEIEILHMAIVQNIKMELKHKAKQA